MPFADHLSSGRTCGTLLQKPSRQYRRRPYVRRNRDAEEGVFQGGNEARRNHPQRAVAASIWYRQSPAGFGYYDYSLSRSWKSVSTGRDGYSDNFFAKNEAELLEVIGKVTKRIQELEAGLAAEKQAA